MSRARVGGREGALLLLPNFRTPPDLERIFPVRVNAVALAERLAIRSGSDGRSDLSERNFPRARTWVFEGELAGRARYHMHTRKVFDRCTAN